MPNTLAGVAPDLIADAGFESLKTSLVSLKAFSTDFSDELTAKGASITTRIFLAKTAVTTENDYENTGGNTTTAVKVTLDKYQKDTFFLEDKDRNDNDTDVMIGFARESGFAVGKAITNDIQSIITNANYGAAKLVIASASFDLDNVADLSQEATTDGVSQNNRTLVLREAYHTAVIKDDGVQRVDASGDSDALRDNNLKRLHNFQVIEAVEIPTNGENLVGYYAHPSALAIATRPVFPQEGSVEAGQIFELRKDEQTGLTMGFRMHYDPGTGRLFGTFELRYGFTKAQGNALGRITSA